jgi:hypothetical protein
VRRLIVATADELEPFAPVADEAQVLRPPRERLITALVQAGEHRNGQAGVVTAALGDDLSVADGRLGYPVQEPIWIIKHRLLESGIFWSSATVSG